MLRSACFGSASVHVVFEKPDGEPRPVVGFASETEDDVDWVRVGWWASFVSVWYELVFGLSSWVEGDGSLVLRTEIDIDAFRGFVVESEPRLRQALSATLGTQAGREATADAMGYAWENWERIQDMQNPVGYLYAVGRDRGRKLLRRKRPLFYAVDSSRLPWVEPTLPSALADLPVRQRQVVVLLHCYQWTMSEVADLLSISKSTVQNHAERGLASLRSSIGVEV